MSEGFYLTYPRAYPSLADLRRFWDDALNSAGLPDPDPWERTGDVIEHVARAGDPKTSGDSAHRDLAGWPRPRPALVAWPTTPHAQLAALGRARRVGQEPGSDLWDVELAGRRAEHARRTPWVSGYRSVPRRVG